MATALRRRAMKHLESQRKMNHKISLYAEVVASPCMAVLHRDLDLPFVPVQGQQLSFADGSHPTCTVSEVDYWVDEDEWSVGTVIQPTSISHLLWTLVRLVGHAGFVMIDSENLDHPRLEGALVDVERDGGVVGWIFDEEKLDELQSVFAREWMGVGAGSRNLQMVRQLFSHRNTDPHDAPPQGTVEVEWVRKQRMDGPPIWTAVLEDMQLEVCEGSPVGWAVTDPHHLPVAAGTVRADDFALAPFSTPLAPERLLQAAKDRCELVARTLRAQMKA